MKAAQFDNIRSTFEKGVTKFHVASGEHTGKTVRFDSVHRYQRTYLQVKVDDVVTRIHYKHLELIDEYGDIAVAPVTDMTGREITIGSYICYAPSVGRSAPVLEIGKIMDISEIGYLKVKPLVRNGEKLIGNYNTQVKSMQNSMRVIKLPVDDKTMIMWIMQDFDEMAKS